MPFVIHSLYHMGMSQELTPLFCHLHNGYRKAHSEAWLKEHTKVLSARLGFIH